MSLYRDVVTASSAIGALWGGILYRLDVRIFQSFGAYEPLVISVIAALLMRNMLHRAIMKDRSIWHHNEDQRLLLYNLLWSVPAVAAGYLAMRAWWSVAETTGTSAYAGAYLLWLWALLTLLLHFLDELFSVQGYLPQKQQWYREHQRFSKQVITWGGFLAVAGWGAHRCI